MLRVVYASLAWLATTPAIALSKADGKGPLMTSPVGIGNMVQMVVGLLVVLGIIFAMAWLIRRMGHVQVRMQGVLKVLGGISIGQRERIVLVQVGEQQLLIGVAPGQIRTLHVLTTPVTTDTNPTNPSGQTFAERLQAMMKHKQP
jgi:flagellar protein FliO/FliZ